ncbi:MAG: alpha/beta hydrolase [Sphingomonadales bacterium]
MKLDPETAALMKQLQFLDGGERDMSAFDISEVRAAGKAMWQGLNGPEPEGCLATPMTLPGPAGMIPARLYRPANAARQILPAVVFFHGGGWALGDLDGYDSLVKSLSLASGACFLSVDYRLAPEHPFPAGLDDALAAVRWVGDEAARLYIDPRRIAVMGDSAGGNLAAVTARYMRAQAGPPLAGQFLIYPMLDVASPHTRYPSRAAYGNQGYVISLRDIEVTTDWYLTDLALASQPKVSPLLAPDVDGLAPAVIMTAGFDPLRDEGHVYAEKLRAAGVPVNYCCFEATVHAFLSFGHLGIAQEGRAWLGAEVRRLLGPSADTR